MNRFLAFIDGHEHCEARMSQTGNRDIKESKNLVIFKKKFEDSSGEVQAYQH